MSTGKEAYKKGNVHDNSGRERRNDGFQAYAKGKQCNGRNKRSVWTINTKPYKSAHFATFPPELPRTCILAGSKKGDTILDPFAGALTTLMVSQQLNRNSIGIELNKKYIDIGLNRLKQNYFDF